MDTVKPQGELGVRTQAYLNGETHRAKREEILVAEAILQVTQAISSIPETQIDNVFHAVRAIYATAHGKQIDVAKDMQEIAHIREQLDGMRREQVRQEKRRGWFGRG